jgi:RNA polymerase sigma-70 factor (ECF subfamily)
MAEQSPAGAEALRLHILVLRCQTGDEQAFARLMDEFGPRTLAHLRGLVGEGAEDVQQDVWLTVYRTIGTLGNPGAFRTWLFRTTRHRAIDFLRKRRRERELLDEAAIVAIDSSEPEVEARIAPIDEPTLEAAMAEMPPLQREVLQLRYQHDMSYADIALLVGCPVGTVRTRLHHAKRRLHERLKRGDR